MQGAALLAQLSELHGDVDAAIGQYEEAHQLCQQQHSEAHPLAVQVPLPLGPLSSSQLPPGSASSWCTVPFSWPTSRCTLPREAEYDLCKDALWRCFTRNGGAFAYGANRLPLAILSLNKHVPQAASMHSALDEHLEAKQKIELVKSATETLSGAGSEASMTVALTLAKCLYELGEMRQCRKLAEQVLAYQVAQKGQADLGTATALELVAKVPPVVLCIHFLSDLPRCSNPSTQMKH